jgi:hypothetical protein
VSKVVFKGEVLFLKVLSDGLFGGLIVTNIEVCFPASKNGKSGLELQKSGFFVFLLIIKKIFYRNETIQSKTNSKRGN